jgi:hypothetical protein
MQAEGHLLLAEVSRRRPDYAVTYSTTQEGSYKLAYEFFLGLEGILLSRHGPTVEGPTTLPPIIWYKQACSRAIPCGIKRSRNLFRSCLGRYRVQNSVN